MAANLADAIARNAADRPSDEALVEVTEGGRSALTWRELDAAVDAAARALDDLGLVAGQRVMIIGHNRIDTVLALFGALRGGLVAVPTNPGLSDSELRRIVAHSGAAVVLSDTGFEPVGEHPPHSLPLAGLGDRATSAQASVRGPLDPEALAALVYTAGTSGQPKGVMLTHRALLAYCRSSAELGLADATARVLAVLPLFHIYGLNAVLGGALEVGATTVLLDGMPDDTAAVLTAERISHLALTPSALYRLSAEDGLVDASGGLRLVTSGAAPLPRALAEHFERLTGAVVEQGYGLTEAAPGISTTFGHPQLGPGHVGRAIPGVELRIGDGSDPQEPGNLHVRGANLFSGYWPDGSGGPNSDGWFDTGDVGYLRGDDLFLVDRSRELVIVSGFNVYPTEIEELLESHESVTEAAVIGQPDERTGERVVAFLAGPAVRPEQVRRFCAEHLARYKVPREFLVLKKLPRSATGKIRKGALRDLLDRSEESEQ